MKKLNASHSLTYQCKEHGIYSSLPCPWPNCPNGILEDEFELTSWLKGEAPNIFRRHEWLSSKEEKYYSWQEDNYPSWFTCKQTFWSEAIRRKLVTERSNLIYHYTNISGLMGILNSGSIWLTDYSYLNDRKEITHGVDIVIRVARELQKKSTNQDINELLESWIGSLSDHKKRVCIASFSADGDSLSQWRAYGRIAIGFEIYQVVRHVRGVSLQSVEYSESVQSELAALYLNHLCQSYLEDNSKNLLGFAPDLYHQTNQLFELISFFKDSSFQGERECRLVYIEDNSLHESMGINKPKIYFRSTGSHIIPYVSSNELYASPEIAEPLDMAEIVLGPGSDELLERGVRELLEYHGKKNIPIRRSSVPYRP